MTRFKIRRMINQHLIYCPEVFYWSSVPRYFIRPAYLRHALKIKGRPMYASKKLLLFTVKVYDHRR